MSIFKDLYDWLYPKPEEPPAVTGETQLQAEAAIESALTDLQDARDRSAEVTELVSRAQQQLNRNHFAELVEVSMSRKAKA